VAPPGMGRVLVHGKGEGYCYHWTNVPVFFDPPGCFNRFLQGRGNAAGEIRAVRDFKKPSGLFNAVHLLPESGRMTRLKLVGAPVPVSAGDVFMGW